MPTINDIIATDTFRRRVSEMIAAELLERSATPYDSVDGFIEGSVTFFDIDSGPTFSEPDGEASEWQVPFQGTGTATVGCKTGDGEYRDCDISGPFDGFAKVTVPDHSFDADADGIAETVEITITIESATLKDKEPEEPFDDTDVE